MQKSVASSYRHKSRIRTSYVFAYCALPSGSTPEWSPSAYLVRCPLDHSSGKSSIHISLYTLSFHFCIFPLVYPSTSLSIHLHTHLFLDVFTDCEYRFRQRDGMIQYRGILPGRSPYATKHRRVEFGLFFGGPRWP